MRTYVIGFLLAGAGAGMSPASAQSRNRQRDLITRAEIESSAKKNDDIYQVIRSLRPHFLARPRGTRSISGGLPREAVLYVNGNRAGELASLRTLMALDIREVRYLDPTKAEELYGITHNGGAVLVTTLRSVTREPPSLH